MVGTAFDIDAINEALAGRNPGPPSGPGQSDPADPSGLPGPLKDLPGAERPASERRLLLR